MHGYLASKEAQERQIGEILARLEYENLMRALFLALDEQVSIANPYFALSTYLGMVKDGRRILALGEVVLPRLRAYPSEVLGGAIGEELIRIVVDIATRQQELRQYARAEAACQESLDLLDAQTALRHEDKEKLKAVIYHNLGAVAQEQRQWQQAEQYYQQALDILIEFNDRYSQASTYHQLGIVAQEQRQWQQAEQYYQQALDIQIEFNDRYSQARTYHNLGIVAEEQRQWQQARDFFLKDLEVTWEFDDEDGLAITLRSLARLWQASADSSLPTAVASRLQRTPEEIETLLTSFLDPGAS